MFVDVCLFSFACACLFSVEFVGFFYSEEICVCVFVCVWRGGGCTELQGKRIYSVVEREIAPN